MNKIIYWKDLTKNIVANLVLVIDIFKYVEIQETTHIRLSHIYKKTLMNESLFDKSKLNCICSCIHMTSSYLFWIYYLNISDQIDSELELIPRKKKMSIWESLDLSFLVIKFQGARSIIYLQFNSIQIKVTRITITLRMQSCVGNHIVVPYSCMGRYPVSSVSTHTTNTSTSFDLWLWLHVANRRISRYVILYDFEFESDHSYRWISKVVWSIISRVWEDKIQWSLIIQLRWSKIFMIQWLRGHR